jgi:nucleoside-diphosphate-sugar epimerase
MAGHAGAVSSALIIGGRGQSGLAIAQRLLAAGWDVTATASGPVPGPDVAPAVTWVSLVRDDVADLGAAVPGEFDVVVDDVAFTPAHAEQLVGLGDRVGSAVVLSTVSVYTDAEGRSMDAADGEESFPAWPDPIPVDWPTLAPGDGYSAGKAAVEALLRERAPWPVTIVRPGAIHGRYSRHLREWYLIKRILDGRRRVILPFGGERVLQPTATVNLAELVALAAVQPGDRTLNCGDLAPPTVGEMSRIVDGLMGWETERILLDGPSPGPTVGDNPWGVPRNVIVDMSVAVDQLGYQQPKTYAEAMADTVPWAVAASEGRDWRDVFPTLARYPDDPFDYAAEDAYLAGR